MGLYEFVIVDKDGNRHASLTGARRRSFATYLNKAGEARFILSPTDPILREDTLLLGHKELRVYRANKLVWGGELVYARLDMDGQDERIEVAAKGYLDLLSKRVVGDAANPVSYTNTDLSTIAADLITDSQALPNGNFGITIGATPTSRPADRTNMQYKNLREAIEGLSNERVQNGLDIEITPGKVFNAYYPRKGRTLPEVVFEWGINIDSFFEIRDATEMANQAIVLGAGEGTSMLTATREAASFLRQTYRLRQAVLYHKDVTETATLESHGDKELALRQLQTQIIGVTTKGDLAPTFGSYEVGDTVRVRVRRGIVAIDGLYRIHGIEVRLSEEDEETIGIVFNQT